MVVPASVFYFGVVVHGNPEVKAWFEARCSVYMMICFDYIRAHYLYGYFYFMLAGFVRCLPRLVKCNEPAERMFVELGELLFKIFWVVLLWCALAPVLREGCPIGDDRCGVLPQCTTVA